MQEYNVSNHQSKRERNSPPLGEATPRSPEPAAVQISGLSKSFGDKRAVIDLNLDIPHGSMFGLVGPNGAGKTTTLSMMMGLLEPDAGSVTYSSEGMRKQVRDMKSRLGVMPDGMRLFDRLSGLELLTYAGLLRGLRRTTVRERAVELLGALGLADDARLSVADYSAGMTRKVYLACALIHAPDVLILDEPLEGIDPVSAHAITQILTRFTCDGGTVILSSHVMEIVERLCNHVAIMVDGRVLAMGTMADVTSGRDLESRFLELVGAMPTAELTWLRPS